MGFGAARPLAINREAGNCAHLQPLACRPPSTLLPTEFSTICTILHFSQGWYRALLHWSTVELSSPSWSYIGHYCSPRGCGASLAAGGGGGQGHKKLCTCKLETAHPSRRHTEEIKFDASHFSPESATRRNLDHGRTNCG